MAASRSLLAILLLSVVAAHLVEDAVSLPEVSLSARKALNHGDSAGLVTTFEEAWSTLGDAFRAAAQVLKGSSLTQSFLSQSLINGGVEVIYTVDKFQEAIKKDKAIIECNMPFTPLPSIIEDFYEQYVASFQDISAYKVLDMAYLPGIAEQYKVVSYPTFLAFFKGDLVERYEGAQLDKMLNLVKNLHDRK
jgi:thiol-disulfide isomerase/thioredoxin